MADTDKESLLRQINDTRRHRAALQRLVDECMVQEDGSALVCSHCKVRMRRLLSPIKHDDGCPWKEAERVLERPVE